MSKGKVLTKYVSEAPLYLVLYLKLLLKHQKTAILSLSQVRWARLKCFTGCIWPPGRRLPHLDKKIRTEIVSDLLSSQIMSHKVLLQFFICVVDAQLLQIISVEALKAVHVQNSCRGTRRQRWAPGAQREATDGCENAEPLKCSPMKLLHVDLSAHMLLLMKVTSHSNNLSGKGQQLLNKMRYTRYKKVIAHRLSCCLPVTKKWWFDIWERRWTVGFSYWA